MKMSSSRGGRKPMVPFPMSPVSAERTDYPAIVRHPGFNVVIYPPPLEAEQKAMLLASVSQHGLMVPLILGDGYLLDGLERLEACEAAGKPFRTVDYLGDDYKSVILGYNDHRRHMTPAQKALRAGELVGVLGTVKEVANRLGISEDYVQKGKTLVDRGSAALQDAVAEGEIKPRAASVLTQLEQEDQDRFLDEHVPTTPGKTPRSRATPQVEEHIREQQKEPSGFGSGSTKCPPGGKPLVNASVEPFSIWFRSTTRREEAMKNVIANHLEDLDMVNIDEVIRILRYGLDLLSNLYNGAIAVKGRRKERR